MKFSADAPDAKSLYIKNYPKLKLYGLMRFEGLSGLSPTIPITVSSLNCEYLMANNLQDDTGFLN